MLAARLVTLRQGIINTSVAAASNFFASHLAMSNWMSEGESGVVCVQFATATSGVLEFILDTGSESTPAIAVVPEGANSTLTTTGAICNYIFPVMGDDAINWSQSLGGTVTIFQCWVVERV